MTAGIYLITFLPSGDTYIGKSKNTETRWEQHLEKIKQKKHSKLIMDAVSRNETMNFKVVLECHEDHIDIMEAFLIDRLQPTLNTQIPTSHYSWAGIPLDILKSSTNEHCYEILSLRGRLKSLENDRDAYKYEGKQGALIKKQEQEIHYLARQLHLINQELNRYQSAPWWKRIFM
jgi:group I intron endonuclease